MAGQSKITTVESLRERIGLVLQDNVLFNTTITNNIKYGTFDAPESAVIDAAQRASLQPFLQSWPTD